MVDGYEIAILVMCLIAVAVSPVVMVKAIRRGDKRRLFDIVLSDAFLVYFATQTFWPSVIQGLPAFARYALLTVPLLNLANWFGLSRRLFRSEAEGRRP